MRGQFQLSGAWFHHWHGRRRPGVALGAAVWHGATDRYEPDEDALGRAPIPEPIRKELFDDYRGLEVPHLTEPEDANETLCYRGEDTDGR